MIKIKCSDEILIALRLRVDRELVNNAYEKYDIIVEKNKNFFWGDIAIRTAPGDFLEYDKTLTFIIDNDNKNINELAIFLNHIDEYKIVGIYPEKYGIPVKFLRYKDKKIKITILTPLRYYYYNDPNGQYTTLFGKQVTRVDINTGTYDRLKTEDLCKKHNVEPNDIYENDISSVHRYYINNVSKENIPSDNEYRIATIDIETDASVDVIHAPNPIISVVIHDSYTNKYSLFLFSPNIENKIFIDKNGDLNLWFSSELKMLDTIANTLKNYDCWCAWNGNSFDFLYMVQRTLTLGKNREMWSPVNKVKFNLVDENDRFDSKNFKVEGIETIDSMVLSKQLFRQKLDKPETATLDATFQFLFPGEKSKISIKSAGHLWHEKKFEELLEYNRQDVKLNVAIDSKMKSLSYLFSLRRLVPHINVSESQYNSIIVDRHMLSKFKNVVFPSKKYSDKISFEGAYVFDPVKGMHHNVALFDFSALYPNIIKTANVSIETISPNGDFVINDVKFLSTVKGILPQLVDDLQQERKKYKLLMAEAKTDDEKEIYNMLQVSTKTVSNSLYGVFALNSFRLYSILVASSITAIGQQLIKSVANILETKYNCKILFGDTDSLAVAKLDNKNSIEDFEVLEKQINAEIPGILKQFTANEKIITHHSLHMEFETFFSTLALTDAKKKYVSIVSLFKSERLKTPRFYARGFEILRRDTPIGLKPLLKQLAYDVLTIQNEKILRDNAEKCRQCIKKMSHTELLIHKQINRNESEYVKTVPQHIRALRYSNKILKTSFDRTNYRFGMIYVCKCLDGRPKTDVIALSSDMDFPSGFVIDHEKFYEMYIKRKIELAFPDISKRIFVRNTLFHFLNASQNKSI